MTVENANAEAIQAWDGPLYDRFVRFRDIVVTGLASHGEEALRLFPPRWGSGCSTLAAASAIPRRTSPA